jgi:hypothetical protein
MLWKSISDPLERARFLAAESARSEPGTMGFVATLIKHDLVDLETAAKHPEAWDAIGLGHEILFTGSAFAPLMQSQEGANIYVAAVWFHEAPYQAARACVVGDDGALRHLELVNNLRLELGQAKTEDARLGIWSKFDKELVQLMRSGVPAFQAFGAGVLKSTRRNVASLGESPELKDAIAKANSPLVTCILKGSTKDSLLALRGSQRVFLRVSAVLTSVPQSPNSAAAAVQPPTPKKLPGTKPTPPTPSAEPPLSTPWSIIVVLIAAATGLLWLLVKKRK